MCRSDFSPMDRLEVLESCFFGFFSFLAEINTSPIRKLISFIPNGLELVLPTWHVGVSRHVGPCTLTLSSHQLSTMRQTLLPIPCLPLLTNRFPPQPLHLLPLLSPLFPTFFPPRFFASQRLFNLFIKGGGLHCHRISLCNPFIPLFFFPLSVLLLLWGGR